MIRFCGKIKSDFEDDILKLRFKQDSIIFLLVGSVISIFGICLALIIHSNAELFKFLIYLILTILMTIIVLGPFRTKRRRIDWDYDITFSDDTIKIIVNHQNGFVITKPIKKVKKVVDYGGYYFLFVFRWETTHGIICQKDLLVEGSLEEFEELFKDKIERKIK